MPKKIENRIMINPHYLNAELKTRGWNHTLLRIKLNSYPAKYIRSNETIKQWNRIGWPQDRYRALIGLLGMDEHAAETWLRGTREDVK